MNSDGRWFVPTDGLTWVYGWVRVEPASEKT
jgi:hypothetical protein